MARKKRAPQRGTRLDLVPAPGDQEALDPSSAAALLGVEYPLIDTTLIIALLSDYSPLLNSHLDEIRSQLGVLEATLVPDSVASVPSADQESASSEPTSTDRDADSEHDLADAVDSRLSRLALNDPPPFAASDDLHANLEPTSGSSRLSRSSSISGSRASNNTSPTSLVDSEGGFEDDVQMLKSLFPTLKEQTLRDALVAESGVPAAIDFLLSVELIRGVEREGRWPDDPTDPSDHEGLEKGLQQKLLGKKASALAPPAASPVLPQGQSQGQVRPALGKSSRKKTTKTVPLVDTLQRRSTPTNSRPASRTDSRPTSRAASPSRRPPPTTSSNAWGTVASLAAFLSEIIPTHPTTYFLSFLHAPEYHSAYTAVRSALASLPSKASSSDEMCRSILEDVYGLALEGGANQAVKDDLLICVRVAGDDVAAVMDLMDLLGEISAWPGDDDLQRYDAVNEQWFSSHFPIDKRDELLSDGWTTDEGEKREPRGRTAKAVSDQANLATGRKTDDEDTVVKTTIASGPVDDGRLSAPGGTLSRSASGRMRKRPVKREVVPQQLLTIGATTTLAEPVQKFVPGAQAPASAFASPTAFDAFGSPSNFSRVTSIRSKSRERQIHPQNWRTISHARKDGKHSTTHSASIPAYGREPPNSSHGSLLRQNSGPSASQVEAYLSQAAVERQKREDAIRLAGRHYRGNLAGGKAVNGAVAGHYALQAREAAERARGWEMKAARMVVSDQLDQSGHTIDLHHLTIVEATTVALESASTWYEREKVRSYGGVPDLSRSKAVGFTPSRPLVVVVGVGRHSAGQKGVLGPAVANALEGGGWRVDRGPNGRGYLVVRGRK